MEEIPLIKIIFGIISSSFIFIGLIPYIRDIKLKKIQPHILSWAGWGGDYGYRIYSYDIRRFYGRCYAGGG